MKLYHCGDHSSEDLIMQLIVCKFARKHIQCEHNKKTVMTLIDQNVVLSDPIAISTYLASGTMLEGSDFEQQNEINEWLEFFNREMHPVCTELSLQILGHRDPNKTKFQYSFQQLRKYMKILDDSLRMKTFFVGDSMTVTDIFFCCHLDRLFKLLFTPDIRKHFNNLMRWYTYVRNTEPFLMCLGKLFLCTKAHLPMFEQEQSMEKSESVLMCQKDDQQFSLEQFKRQFQNSEDKDTVINNLLKNFPVGYSIWKIYYNKDVTQGKVDFLTANLAKGSLRQLEDLRKTGFGNWGVYYSEQDKQFQIRGIMMWKGNQIANQWKSHTSHEYHIFKKLEPQATETHQLVKDYWLNNDKVEGLSYYDSYLLI